MLQPAKKQSIARSWVVVGFALPRPHYSPDFMKITYPQFLKAVDASKGRKLLTAGGRATFTVARTNGGVRFTPTSSGKPRQHSRAGIEPFLERFNTTGSLITSDYPELRSHSYVLAIFRLAAGLRNGEMARKLAATVRTEPRPVAHVANDAGSTKTQHLDEACILLKWKDRVSSRYTDVLPLSLFAVTGLKRGITHFTRDPGHGEVPAKCDITVGRSSADLDYKPYGPFNRPRGMLLGVARLSFADADRTAVRQVQWKPKGKVAFIDYPLAAAGYEIPTPPPYNRPRHTTSKRERMIRERRGQQAFRRNLRSAYNNRCCMTPCAVADALEGAHIDPYRAPGSNNVHNGLLLRKDVHALFDKHLISVEPDTLIIRVSKCALGPGGYAEIHGRKLKRPSDPSCYPDPGALRRHWRQFERNHPTSNRHQHS